MKYSAMRTVFVSLATLACCSIAFGDERYLPVQRITGISGVSESSFKWNPQIQEAYSPGLSMPPNPRPPVTIFEGNNTLPVGGMLSVPRGTVRGYFPGISATGWVPPDPNIAVGPGHIVEVVNSDIAWFDKATGTKQFQVSMAPIPGPAEGFFESLGATDFVFDPKCFFDAVSGRFFVLALEVEDAAQISKILIAVSDDNNPNGTWRKYRLESKLTVGGNTYWLDYPGFGCNKDAVVVTGNMFGFTSGFAGAQAIVIPKAPLLTGGAASETQILVNNAASVQIARTSDPSLAVIYMTSKAATNTTMRVYAVTSPLSSPAVVSTTVPVPAFFGPQNNAESTNGHFLDSIDGRIWDADWRVGKLVSVHTVNVSQTDTRCNMRWYEFGTGTWPASGSAILNQAGNVFGTAGQHFNMGGIAVNNAGDVAITFTRSSSSIVADQMIAARTATDPPGTMGQPVLVVSSLGSSYGGSGTNRWGDYFSVEVDPSDGLTFWSVGMIGAANGNWLTVINQHQVSTIIPGTIVNFPPTSLNIYNDPLSTPNLQGSNLLGSFADLAVSDDGFATIDSVQAPRFGQIAAGAITAHVDPAGGTVSDLRVRVEANAPLNTTGMIFVWDYTTNKYVQLKSFPLKPTGNTVIELILTKPYSKWLGPNGDVKIVVRGLAPIRIGGIAPASFTLRMDMVNVRARIL